MSYPSRPNWEWGRDRRVYGVVFFEHLPIHTQTIGANASGVWEASYSWEGGSGANILTSHDSIIILSVYILTSGGAFVFICVLFSTDTQHLDCLRRLSEGGVPTFVYTVHSSSIFAFL